MAGRNSTPSDFYVYLHRRATDGSVFYVGKGTGNRAYSTRRNEHWKRVAAKYGYFVQIVQDKMLEWWAFEMEKDLIAKYGKNTLCNMTDGGEGLSGLLFTKEHKRKIGEAHKGRKKPKHVIDALRKANTGKKLSEEHKSKISKIHLGRKHTEEHIKNAAEAKRGKPHTDIAKINIRKSKCKIVLCVETGQIFYGTHHATEWVKTFNHKASQAAIARVCNSVKKTAYGYTWKYQNENT